MTSHIEGTIEAVLNACKVDSNAPIECYKCDETLKREKCQCQFLLYIAIKERAFKNVKKSNSIKNIRYSTMMVLSLKHLLLFVFRRCK